MSDSRRSLASRVLQGVTSRVESATRVQWEELRRLAKQLLSSSLTITIIVLITIIFIRLPKQISSSSITIGSEVILILPKNLPKIQIEFSFAAGKFKFFFAIELSSAGTKVEEPQLREGFAEMQGAWQGRTWQGKHKNNYRARCRNLFRSARTS